MEETDSDRGGEACAAGLKGGEGEGALKDMLGCFEEAVAGNFSRETSCAGEGLDDAVGALVKGARLALIQKPRDSITSCRSYHTTEKTLEGQPGESGS